MPDAAPTQLPLCMALDEGLALLFRKLQAEPAPAALMDLVDRLEATCAAQGVAAERRAIS